MNCQKIATRNGVNIEVMIAKAPVRIVNKAKGLIVKLVEKDMTRGMRPKILKRKRKWLSYRVNHKYRILVLRNRCSAGPYYCFSHAEFDHWISQY